MEINPAGLQLLEVAGIEEIEGQPLADFVNEENREAFHVCLDALLRWGEGVCGV